MGTVFSFLTGVLVGAATVSAGVAYLFLYGAQHLGPVVKKHLAEAEKEQKIVLQAITNRGESIVYPLTGINTTPPIHRLGETNLCLRMNGGILSIYQPERNSTSGVSKHRSASIMQVLAQFHVDRIIVHSVTSRRIEIEALSSATDAICDVTFSTISVPAHRISIDFVYRHEAAEVFSRCIAGGAGAVGGSVFLRNSYRHVPAYYKFLSNLPQKKLSPATLLLSRILGASNDVRALKPFILSKLKKKLDKVKLPSPVKGTIEVADLKLGKNSPAIGDIRVVNDPLTSTDGTVELAADIEYNGGFELALIVEIEVDSFISVKVPSITVTIKVNHLSGVIRLLAIPPPAKDLWIAFETTPEIKIGFQQQVNGANSIMKTLASKIPDLSEIVTDVVKSSLLSDMVLPNRDDIPLPIIGETPPSTPAEPENDASIFEHFREGLPRSVREKGKMASPTGVSSSDASPLMASDVSTKNLTVKPNKNFQDDDIIFNSSGGSSVASPNTSSTSAATAAPVISKKTVHLSGDSAKDLYNIDTTVSARAKADTERMRKEQEEKEKKEKEAAEAEKQKKKNEEPSLIDRFLSPSSSSDSKKEQQQQNKDASSSDKNPKTEEKGIFDKISDKYHEYEKKKQREEEEKKKKQQQEQQQKSNTTSPALAPTPAPAQEEKGIFDKLSDKYHEYQHQREEEDKKKKQEEAEKKKQREEEEKKKKQEEEDKRKKEREAAEEKARQSLPKFEFDVTTKKEQQDDEKEEEEQKQKQPEEPIVEQQKEETAPAVIESAKKPAPAQEEEKKEKEEPKKKEEEQVQEKQQQQETKPVEQQQQYQQAYVPRAAQYQPQW